MSDGSEDMDAVDGAVGSFESEPAVDRDDHHRVFVDGMVVP
jgi:hypothetical protein